VTGTSAGGAASGVDETSATGGVFAVGESEGVAATAASTAAAASAASQTGGRRGPTAIVCALPGEMAAVLAAAGSPFFGGDGWRRGRLGGEDVALAVTGDGAAAAASRLERLLESAVEARRPRRLLVLGVAGGLTPGLAAGTLVAARRVVDERGGAAPSDPDAEWLEAALACGATAGIAVTAARIVGDAVAKAALYAAAVPAAAAGLEAAAEAGEASEPRAARATRAEGEAAMAPDTAATANAATANAAAAAAGAAQGLAGVAAPGTAASCGTAPAIAGAAGKPMGSPVATVDLETLAYARVAAAYGLPYLAVRAVLDAVDETLPLDFEACRAADGRVSNARVALTALAHPGSFASLWRLRARVKDASARLAALAGRLLAFEVQSRSRSDAEAETLVVAGRRRA
jgi:nucleoside phosphorylase